MTGLGYNLSECCRTLGSSEDFVMPVENHFQHQQYPTEPVVTPVLRTLNVNDAAEADFSKLHTVLKIGRVVLVHGTFMGDDPFGIADTLKSVATAVPLLAGPLNRLAEVSVEKRAPLPSP